MSQRRARRQGSRNVLLLGTVLVLAQCGGDDGGDRRSERSRIIDTVRAARAALLDGDGRAACSTLTSEGRALAVRLSAYLQQEGGLRRGQRAGSCEEAVRDERVAANEPGRSWPGDLRRASFTVEAVSARRATVRLTVGEPPAPRFHLLLHKTPSGWRIQGAREFAALARPRPPAGGQAPKPPPQPPEP